jgi:hypothetical protein
MTTTAQKILAVLTTTPTPAREIAKQLSDIHPFVITATLIAMGHNGEIKVKRFPLVYGVEEQPKPLYYI